MDPKDAQQNINDGCPNNGKKQKEGEKRAKTSKCTYSLIISILHGHKMWHSTVPMLAFHDNHRWHDFPILLNTAKSLFASGAKFTQWHSNSAERHWHLL
ncbi:hypothetical protein niasHT_021491 [Heterodera trifolii]|uniref:Uncharacterized protein n=1 Tax=Heterodera trifolii TaxID=157864 RepID=A0ABD2KEJ9_9BILA